VKPSASTNLADILKPTTTGETVNVHVVDLVQEPRPDFAAMQRTIESGLGPAPADDQSRAREK
jgi:hypothetical protein